VAFKSAWPSSSCTMRIPAPFASMCVAHACRSRCGRMPARVRIATYTPCAVNRLPINETSSGPRVARRRARYSRAVDAAFEVSGTMRVLFPLPVTRTVCPSRSTSSTFTLRISSRRSPEPYASSTINRSLMRNSLPSSASPCDYFIYGVPRRHCRKAVAVVMLENDISSGIFRNSKEREHVADRCAHTAAEGARRIKRQEEPLNIRLLCLDKRLPRLFQPSAERLQLPQFPAIGGRRDDQTYPPQIVEYFILHRRSSLSGGISYAPP
jgi:hypothetical protein